MDRRILIVDDEAESVMLAEAMLKEYDYQIITAANGREALEKIRDNPPHMVIADVLMPEMDGYKLYKEIRNNEKTKDVPFLVVSVRKNMQDTFLALGVDFMLKPFDPDTFLNKINGRFGVKTRAVALEPSAEAPQEAVSPLPKTADRPAASVRETGAEESKPARPAEPVKPAQERLVKNVLLAGDTFSVLEKIKGQLIAQKCAVTVITDGKKILKAALESKPDLMVLDVIVSGFSVHEVIRRIRRDPDLKEKIIITFSYWDKDDLGGLSLPQKKAQVEGARTVCMDAGINEYIGAFEEKTFLPAIAKYLK